MPVGCNLLLAVSLAFGWHGNGPVARNLLTPITELWGPSGGLARVFGTNRRVLPAFLQTTKTTVYKTVVVAKPHPERTQLRTSTLLR